MTSALRVLVFALLYTSAGASHIDDATAMIQSRANVKTSEDDPMLLMKSTGVGHLMQVEGSERLAATQKMEKSMELAVMKMMAGMKAGNYTPLPPEFYEPIEAQMELMRKELLGERDGFQQQVNLANANVEKCNTNMQNTSDGSVATAKANKDSLKSTHHSCRVAEEVAYNAKTSSCAALAAETVDAATAAPQCNCALSTTDTSAVLTCLESNDNWVEEFETVLQAKELDCNTKTTTWSNKADDCDSDQSSYEAAVCNYAMKLENMRSTLDTCYDDAIEARTSTLEMVKVEEEHLKAVLASAKKIICFLRILKRAGTENLTMSDFETCKQMDVHTDTTHLNNSVPDMNITYLPAVGKDTDRFEWNLTIMPGDGLWAAHEYANYTKAWLRDTTECSHKTTTTQAAQLYWVSDGCPNHGENPAAELRAKSDIMRYRCCHDDGSCTDDAGGCIQDTHDGAIQACLAVGQHLCTKEELEARNCCGKGCSFDNKLLWTSTPE